MGNRIIKELPPPYESMKNDDTLPTYNSVYNTPIPEPEKITRVCARVNTKHDYGTCDSAKYIRTYTYKNISFDTGISVSYDTLYDYMNAAESNTVQILSVSTDALVCKPHYNDIERILINTNNIGKLVYIMFYGGDSKHILLNLNENPNDTIEIRELRNSIKTLTEIDTSIIGVYYWVSPTEIERTTIKYCQH
jgi:hypothetical protein